MPLSLSRHEGTQWGMQTKFIPGGSQTVSKQPERFVQGMYPKLIKSAKGCFLEDLDGNTYTDYICALGPIILGYCNKLVDRAVKEQIDKGILFSLPSPEEWGLAKSLNYHIPCAEKSKFFKTGSDATTAAVKVARAYTNKERVLVCGYHGWDDWYSIVQDNKKGIPKRLQDLVEKFEYNNVQSLLDKFHTDDVACVIIEPVMFQEPQNEFLQQVKDICHEHNALLIFDEVITGFRLHLGGAQSRYKVTPDLSTFSKAMGNGYPIAALVGKAQYMDIFESPGFFISGTFGGDLVGISAAKETIRELERNDQQAMKDIWTSGKALKSGFNHICETKGLEGVYCEGLGPRTRFVFPSLEHKAVFYQECIREGIMFGPTNFINKCHSKIVIDMTLNVCDRAISKLKDNWDNPKAVYEGSELPREVILR